MRKLVTLIAFLSAGSLTAQAQANLLQQDFTGEIVPQYIIKGGSAQRLPTAFRARISGLTPGTTYRYYVQAASAPNLGTASSGAGNPLFIRQGGQALYTTQPNLSTNCDSLTTDSQGSYVGWFGFVTTNNRRFNPDTLIIPTITLNNGAGGIDPALRRALDQTLRVLVFGTNAADTSCTGIRGTSLAAPKNAVAIYDNAAGAGRPIAITYVEPIGATIASLVPWYTANVAGQAGAWGAFVPNSLAAGIRGIYQYDASGSVVGNNISPDGTWGATNTVNPSGGTANVLVIDAGTAPLNQITEVALAKAQLQKSLRVWMDGQSRLLHMQSDEAISLQVSAVTGQVMAGQELAAGKAATLTTEHWPTGLYLVTDRRTGRRTRIVVGQ